MQRCSAASFTVHKCGVLIAKGGVQSWESLDNKNSDKL